MVNNIYFIETRNGFEQKFEPDFCILYFSCDTNVGKVAVFWKNINAAITVYSRIVQHFLSFN